MLNNKMILVFHLSIWLLVSCKTMSVSQVEVPRINQLEYIAELRKQQSELLKLDCKGNLIAKPEFRDLILSGQSMSSLIKKRYPEDLQKEDFGWANGYRKLKTFGTGNGYEIASYYDPEYYVGFLVGDKKPSNGKNLLTHPFIDDRGIGFKVFFQLKDFQKNLRAEAFQSFAHILAAAGFRGDLKVQLHPGNMRFKFNNIVIHSASMEDSFRAESAGLKFFKGKLAAISRGVDVDVDPKGKRVALDWSEYLCSEDFEKLSPDVKDYVNYK